MKTCIHADALPTNFDDALTLLSVITRREIAPFLNLLRDFIISKLSEEDKQKIEKVFEKAMMEESETEEETKLCDGVLNTPEEKKVME